MTEFMMGMQILAHGKGHAGLLGNELEVVPVKRFDMVRIDSVLHDLEPVAWNHAMSHIAVAMHRVSLVPRELGSWPFADVGPHQPAEFLSFAGTNSAVGPELWRRLWFGQDL